MAEVALSRPVSPQAFLVNGEVFYNPHPGAQTTALVTMARRVTTGEGPRRFFLRGNRGGGKSTLVRRGLLHGLAMALPGWKYVVVRRNMPELRQNHLIHLHKEMETLGGSYHGTHAIAHYPNGSMGFYRQCESERDVEKVVGCEADALFVDEAPQVAWEHQRTMAPSLRVATGADGTPPWYTVEVYSGNPVGDAIEELDRYFLDRDVDPADDPDYRPGEWACLPLGLDDNPSLDKREYLKQFAGLPEHYRRAWVDGVRMDARTLFTVHPTVTRALCTHKGDEPREEPWPERLVGRPYHVIPELPRIGPTRTPLLQTPGVAIYRGFDMGYFPDPAYCLWWAVYGKRIVAVQEQAWFKTVASDLAVKIRETTRELVGPDVPVVMTAVDPEIGTRTGVDVTVMDTLESGGVACEPSVNDRVLYADALHGLLGEELEPGVPRFQIYDRGCPLLVRYLPKMRWDERHPRRMAQHRFDHPAVTCAYLAISSGVLGGMPDGPAAPARPAWMDWITESRRGRRRRD